MNKNKSFHDRVAAVVAGQKVEELKAAMPICTGSTEAAKSTVPFGFGRTTLPLGIPLAA